jgi:hypothetical protein
VNYRKGLGKATAAAPDPCAASQAAGKKESAGPESRGEIHYGAVLNGIIAPSRSCTVKKEPLPVAKGLLFTFLHHLFAIFWYNLSLLSNPVRETVRSQEEGKT